MIAPATVDASLGTFERTWGRDVVATDGDEAAEICTVAADCKEGIGFSGAGEFVQPSDVAVDGSGNVYVADRNNNRIQKFNLSGAFIRMWGKDVDGSDGGDNGAEICTVAADCKAGVGGTLAGEFTAPEGIAADSSGNVYVVESGLHRVQKFGSTGSFLRMWGKDVDTSGDADPGICTNAADCQAGTPGGLGGEFNIPQAHGVGTDVSGNVYVADGANHRIQKFNAAGGFLLAWGKSVDTGGGPTCTPTETCKAGVAGDLGGEFAVPQDVAVSGGGNVYVSDGSNQRLQKFNSSAGFLRAWGKDVDGVGGSGGAEICTVAANCKAGVAGTEGGEFRGPRGVATDGGGSVYVAEQNGNRVQKFSSSGSFLRAWGKDVVVNGGGSTGFEICTVAASCKFGVTGVLGGELDSPIGLASGGAGAVYVADHGNRRIQKFAADPVAPPPPPPPPPPEPPTPPPATVEPENEFEIGKLKKELKLTVVSVGVASVTDARAGKRKLNLKPSSASGGPGTIHVKLKLTKRANRMRKRDGKVKVNANVTFTPNGGSPNSKTKKLKVKK